MFYVLILSTIVLTILLILLFICWLLAWGDHNEFKDGRHDIDLYGQDNLYKTPTTEFIKSSYHMAVYIALYVWWIYWAFIQ